MAQESLKEKTIKGTGWSAVDNIANQGITFLTGLVLARLLTPEEYGLIAIISIFINVFNSFVDSGLSNALIRKNNANDTDYNTVFWSNLSISVLLSIVLFFGAIPIAKFFSRPQLEPLTQVMSVILIINAFAIIQRTILIKKIDFKTQTKVSLIASISSGVVGIAMAFIGLGVWALVLQQITRQFLNSLFLWIFSKWRPMWEFSKSSFNDFFGFGWKLLVSSIIGTIWNELYQVVIGRFYTPATLGQYTRASQFGSIFSSNITGVVMRVSYPVLSGIKEDKERLREAYRRIIKVTMLVTMCCMIGLAGCAGSFVYVLVGRQWMDCVPMLQILCFNLMLYPLHSINLNMLQVQGRSDIFLKLEIIKRIIGIGPLLLGVFVGIYWMLISSVFVGFFSFYLNARFSGPYLNYDVLNQVKDIMPSFFVALLMGLIVYFIGLIKLNPFILLPVQVLVGVVCVILICKLMRLNEYNEIKVICVNTLIKLKSLI